LSGIIKKLWLYIDMKFVRDDMQQQASGLGLHLLIGTRKYADSAAFEKYVILFCMFKIKYLLFSPDFR